MFQLLCSTMVLFHQTYLVLYCSPSPAQCSLLLTEWCLVYCSSPPRVQHGAHNGPSEAEQFPLETVLKYTCYPGYLAVGFAHAKCFLYNTSAQWFGPDLTCKRKTLPETSDCRDHWYFSHSHHLWFPRGDPGWYSGEKMSNIRLSHLLLLRARLPAGREDPQILPGWRILEPSTPPGVQTWVELDWIPP